MGLIIAEIGTSHESSREKAHALIDTAADAGADAVKFQWVYADEILHPETGFVTLPTGKIRLYDRFKNLECPPDFYADMRDYAHHRGVQFGCSPFGLQSLAELLEIRPDFIKIASPELNHYPLLEALASYRDAERAEGRAPVPVILSSGVSKLSDIERALEIVGREGVTLLHCITSYPAPEDEYNLRLIGVLRAVFGVETGVSDHSVDPVLVPSLCVAQGGTVIEKHITLSRTTDGLDDPIALEGAQFASMTKAVRACFSEIAAEGGEGGGKRIIERMAAAYGEKKVCAALGDGIKRLAPSERANYGRTNRSLHFVRSMKSGEIVAPDDAAVLRTEKNLSEGISPSFLGSIIGARLTKDVSAGSGIQFSDFMTD